MDSEIRVLLYDVLNSILEIESFLEDELLLSSMLLIPKPKERLKEILKSLAKL